MKIGVITLPLYANYGGILQAFALQYYLKKHGHEVVLLDRGVGSRLTIRTPYLMLRRLMAKLFRHSKRPVFAEYHAWREKPIIGKNTWPIINQKIKRIEIHDFSKLKNEDFDVLIVGSDQIWRKAYFNPIQNAFLDFASGWNIRRIAYAPSFGISSLEYTEKEVEDCSMLLKKFDLVTVREESGIDICRTCFNVTASHVLDPTMLLDKDTYIEEFQLLKQERSKGNLMVYLLDKSGSSEEIIKHIETNFKLNAFSTNVRYDDRSLPLSERIQKPLEYWLRGFYDAEFVITDSFHACVFSILFNKDFIVYGNKDRGLDRFTSLLKNFNLEDRLVSDPKHADEVVSSKIDWNRVNEILSLKRRESEDLLLNYINHVN